MMSSLGWTRCFMCSFFLFTFLECQTTSGITGKCDCKFDGKVYDLSTLQSTEKGTPRFIRKKKDDSGYEVSYNPCASFSFGTELGDCFDDVAICLSTAASNENIGTQDTAKCGEDEDGKYLEYRNKKIPNWKAKVYLNCSETRKSPDSANFEVIDVTSGKNAERTFRLSHICACGDGCLPKKSIVLPVCLGAAGVIIVIAVPLAFWLYRRWQRNNNPPLIDEDRDYETFNNISQPEGRRKDTNMRRSVSPPISVNSPSCSDIRELSKDKFNYVNNGGRASAPV